MGNRSRRYGEEERERAKIAKELETLGMAAPLQETPRLDESSTDDLVDLPSEWSAEFLTGCEEDGLAMDYDPVETLKTRLRCLPIRFEFRDDPEPSMTWRDVVPKKASVVLFAVGLCMILLCRELVR